VALAVVIAVLLFSCGPLLALFPKAALGRS